jgi:hypothetical protein
VRGTSGAAAVVRAGAVVARGLAKASHSKKARAEGFIGIGVKKTLLRVK